MNPTALDTALRQTVQELPDARKHNGATAGEFWSVEVERADVLPAWGTRQRERWLRWYDRQNYNTLWQGASAGLVKKFAATPSELKGGKILSHYFDDVLRYAQFGKGQRTLKKLVARDYLRFDGGAYVEVIAPGNPLKAPTGRLTGLAHLDSYMCMSTGDPVYPVLYTDRKGKQHLMHHTRVLHFVDMPDGDQNNPGYGLCALSRAIAVVERQILMNRYVVTSLDDKPPPGMYLVGGLTKSQWNARWQEYRQEQATDERPTWGKAITFHGVDADHAPTITPVTFSNPPEKFDYKVYVELDVHEFALAIGVDIQDLWELTSGNLGSQGQSEVQHAKSRGNTLGEMLSEWELGMNNYVLPPSLEYEHKVRDPYEANERATNAQTWAGFVSSAGESLTPNEKRQILANQVEAVADAILDEDGKLIRLPDADPVAPNQQQDITTDDATPNSDPPADGQPEASVQDATPNANAGGLRRVKEFDAAPFVANLTDLLNAGAADEIGRRRAGVVMRAMLNTAGKQARLEGLKQGGVNALADADLNAHTVWLAQQSGLVSSFLTDAYKNGLSDAEREQHARMWANVSLQQAYYEGVASADADGVYVFDGTDGVKSCVTCRSLEGRKMRMSEWAAQKLRPGVDTESYDCGGYQCKHRLTKVSAA